MLAKEKEQPKSILLKIFTENIKNCACSVTITVTNSDTANDTINMLLTMLGITGSEKDFQLWVSSGKEKLPLTGKCQGKSKMGLIRFKIVTQSFKVMVVLS
ncbi:rho GTPase-activating protein 20-like [Canis lupus familiaris]|uniref:rho GTPase-activating protein 20-like n=1 Tax=Canis lupus familiaris TaxID=9615 RepID=UPI0018F6BFF3|nr:rho GTPase-activating protein 20-like [Canis lupus familiaris]